MVKFLLDTNALSEAIHLAKQHLAPGAAKGYVLVDITSGQATCSGVAAALSVYRQEWFQYVSTEDYTVRLYDLRLEPAPSPKSGE